MTILSNHYCPDEDGYERIDIVITGTHFAIPTLDFLAGMVMRVDRPKPHEIVMVEPIFKGKQYTYRLFIKRDACPVMFFGGNACPMCGGSHGAS